MKNLSFDHVHYRSSDLEISREFYIEKMEGIELPSEILAKNKNLHFVLGGVSLLFVESSDGTVPPSPQLGVYHIAFLVDNCEEATNYYCDRGVTVDDDKKNLKVSDNIIASFINAPDGMMVELKQIIQ
jgi:catechol-2,3-dioxygenase